MSRRRRDPLGQLSYAGGCMQWYFPAELPDHPLCAGPEFPIRYRMSGLAWQLARQGENSSFEKRVPKYFCVSWANRVALAPSQSPYAIGVKRGLRADIMVTQSARNVSSIISAGRQPLRAMGLAPALRTHAEDWPAHVEARASQCAMFKPKPPSLHAMGYDRRRGTGYSGRCSRPNRSPSFRLSRTRCRP